MIPFPEALRALYRPCWLAGREIAVKCATSIIQENGIAEPETLLPRFVDSPNSVTTSMLRLQKNMTKYAPRLFFLTSEVANLVAVMLSVYITNAMQRDAANCAGTC